jgi:hypothetical protein
VTELSPRANRLPMPGWLDARVALGLALVLIAVVAGARLFASADHYSRVYLVRRPLVPGERIASGDLSVGRIRFAGDGRPYLAVGTHSPVGALVTRYVAAGEVLPSAALSAGGVSAVVRDVTVPVVPGHLPADLGHGDQVDVYVTTKGALGATSSAAPHLVLARAVVDSDDAQAASLAGQQAVGVVLAVPAEAVSRTVAAVEDGSIDLVRVPADAVIAPTVSASAPA